ncbi:MAG: tRNA-dihydrouridine synthase, partial [Hyphomicrobiales bacterium]|nr:tRNA-dihydrouridine synthase [Hyphomicrobiales bacterium]
MSIPAFSIGGVPVKNGVFLAPLSGVTDASFRALAAETGAGLVVSEMIASEDLIKGGEDATRKLRAAEDGPFIVQRAG